MPDLIYSPLERVAIRRPVSRLGYIAEHCRGNDVLDLGCYDETALSKADAGYWLHARIAAEACSVLGIDNSESIPDVGLTTEVGTCICRGDVRALDTPILEGRSFDVIVAGELIEHLPDTLAFFTSLKQRFPGKELIVSTPNATSLTNGLLALVRRESCHKDHLQVYSYKTLNTLCHRAGFENWEIVPYHVYFTEMILRSGRVARAFLVAVERIVNVVESCFPLLSGGLILHVHRM